MFTRICEGWYQSRDSQTLRVFVHRTDDTGFPWVSAHYYGNRLGTSTHKMHPDILARNYVHVSTLPPSRAKDKETDAYWPYHWWCD